jgi:hypothetical protein
VQTLTGTRKIPFDLAHTVLFESCYTSAPASFIYYREKDILRKYALIRMKQ